MLEKTDVLEGVKRTQSDYSLSFKLSVVDEVEKGSFLTRRHNVSMGYKAGVQFWFGYGNMVA
jgi:hypothetical protein